MFCPNCGKDCGNAKFCPECGQKLTLIGASSGNESKWKGIPCITFKGVTSYLKLREKELVIQNHKNPEYVIPYDQIVDIQYFDPNVLAFQSGRLAIRYQGNADKPILKSYYRSVRDETTFFFNDDDKERVFNVYHILKDNIRKG